ncbi:MAG: hypothetical protein KDD98_10945, partial [Sphingomonadaceae bacterium]|nr:hypothetical protein [Sphingomonadaceae bacterium]
MAKLKITSRKALEVWLEDKPREWAHVIALRAALRVLPFAFDPANFETAPNQRLTAAVFRAMAVSSGAAKILPNASGWRAVAVA